MSMMSQKLNREGTVAFEQLNELKKLNKPELFKLAQSLGLDNLVLVTRSWEIPYNWNSYSELNFGGRFFGEFKITFSHMSKSDTNTNNAGGCALRDNGVKVSILSTFNRSDGSSRGNSAHSTYVGFADAMHKNTINSISGGQDPYTSMLVSFIGYEVGLPIETILNNIVTNQGYKLADNAGNIISIP